MKSQIKKPIVVDSDSECEEVSSPILIFQKFLPLDRELIRER
jgi:hypothetical protein